MIRIERPPRCEPNIGILYLEDEFFCYTLEDPERDVKIPGETCIPKGLYKYRKTYSNRFKREMILIYNREDLSCQNEAMTFTGIRIHGGNGIEDTDGCVIVAKFRKFNGVYNSMESELMAATPDSGEIEIC